MSHKWLPGPPCALHRECQELQMQTTRIQRRWRTKEIGKTNCHYCSLVKYKTFVMSDFFNHKDSFSLNFASLDVKNISVNTCKQIYSKFKYSITYLPKHTVVFSSKVFIHSIKVLVCDQLGLGDDIVFVTKVDTGLNSQ